eukprot:RCo005647
MVGITQQHLTSIGWQLTLQRRHPLSVCGGASKALITQRQQSLTAVAVKEIGAAMFLVTVAGYAEVVKARIGPPWQDFLKAPQGPSLPREEVQLRSPHALSSQPPWSAAGPQPA